MLEWNDSYSVGVDAIDKDHQILFTLLGRYLEESKSKSPVLIHNLFRDLQNYTNFHFDREEDLMARCEYENLEEHKKQHQAIRDKLKNFSDNITKRSSDEETEQFQLFLSSWLLNHVLSEDLKYKESMAKLNFL